VGLFQRKEAVGKCTECNSVAAKKDHGVGCEMCEKWFHITCVGIDIKVYDGLKQLNMLVL